VFLPTSGGRFSPDGGYRRHGPLLGDRAGLESSLAELPNDVLYRIIHVRYRQAHPGADKVMRLPVINRLEMNFFLGAS